ncbi:MAG: CCA tRNA nucleotidyltransferase [Akkermansia sp.]
MMIPSSSLLYDSARRIVTILHEAGYIAYFAGGCVRDMILGVSCHDIDIVTSAKPDEVMGLFPRSRAVGVHFGVVLVPMDGTFFDVATFRKDGVYEDGRRPVSVSFSTAEKDAQRRDFTVNGLFENPLTGEIIDFVHGKEDVEHRIIRSIGNPRDRFSEDALRLLRAVRFAVTKGFSIEPVTMTALSECANLLQKISPERIRDEFDKILLCPRRREGVELLVETGLMRYIIPEIEALIGCEQPPKWHPEGDVFTHTMMMLDELPIEEGSASLELVLSTLLHDIGKPVAMFREPSGRIRFSGHDDVGREMSHDILKRLHYSNVVIDAVSFMVGRHMQFINVQNMREGKVKQFMASPVFEDELLLHRADCLCSNGALDNYDYLVEKRVQKASTPILPKPLLTGKHLIDLGWTPGKEFKSVLDYVFMEQLEGRVCSLKDALMIARRLHDEQSDVQ